jgi:hypothetical protein
MKSRSNILDVKGYTQEETLSRLQQRSAKIKEKGCLWLIYDHEPTACYPYLTEHDFYFQTFIVSKKEYRLFISRP